MTDHQKERLFPFTTHHDPSYYLFRAYLQTDGHHYLPVRSQTF